LRTIDRVGPLSLHTNHAVIQATNMVREVPGTNTPCDNSSSKRMRNPPRSQFTFHRDVAAEEVRERPALSAITPRGLRAVIPDPQAHAARPKNAETWEHREAGVIEAMQSFPEIEGRLHWTYLYAPRESSSSVRPAAFSTTNWRCIWSKNFK
jgi:hypothetical protein